MTVCEHDSGVKKDIKQDIKQLILTDKKILRQKTQLGENRYNLEMHEVKEFGPR